MNINLIGTTNDSHGELVHQYEVIDRGLRYRIDYFGDSNPKGRDLIFTYWDEISLVGIYEREQIFTYECDTNYLKRRVYGAITQLLYSINIDVLSCDRF